MVQKLSIPRLDLVQVLGALNKRGRGEKLAALLKDHFTVVSYDRRGRGDSADSLPYSVHKEVEDIEAIINYLGGEAFLYDHSSGAILALLAAQKLQKKIQGVAVYEVPYNDDQDALKVATAYKASLLQALEHDQNDKAVELFVTSVGVSDKQIAAMKKLPMWKGLTAMAHTLRYDTVELMESYPNLHLQQIKVPAIVMYGEKSPSFMEKTAQALDKSLSKATLEALKDQTHDVKATAVAPILIKYFK